MLDPERLRRTKEWASRQQFVNGRFAEVDTSTGEALSEHKHPRFIRVGDFIVNEYERPERMYEPKTALGQSDGTWARIWPDGTVMRRAYTYGERLQAIGLASTGMTMAAVARQTGIPRRTVQAWVRRHGDALDAA
jgi:hypothetical protein